MLATTLIAGAVVGYEQRGYHSPADAGEVPLATVIASTTPPVVVGPTVGPWSPAPARPAAFRPDRVAIPKLHVAAPVRPVNVAAGGGLGVPDDPQVLGWWSSGAWPGAEEGTVVIDGHVDSARLGAGALFALEMLTPGDVIMLHGNGHSRRYLVVARHIYRKSALPPETFATSGRPRLVVITCGGPFDRRTRHYRDNVVVYAVPASPA